MAGTDPRTPARTSQPAWSWTAVLRAAAWTSIAVSAFAVVTIGGGMESIVFAALVGVGLWWLRRSDRNAVIYLGAVHLVIGLIVLVFYELFLELAYPASWKVFVATSGRLVATVTALVATGGALRRPAGDGRLPRVVAAVASVCLLGLVVVGIAVGLRVADDERQPGDVAVVITKDTQFEPRRLNVSAGRIAVYVENQDVHHGTFTIDGIVSLEVPAGSAKRATFDLSPGEYRYFSELYQEEAFGTLVVT